MADLTHSPSFRGKGRGDTHEKTGEQVCFGKTEAKPGVRLNIPYRHSSPLGSLTRRPSDTFDSGWVDRQQIMVTRLSHRRF